jgi:hypothetical protein
MRALTEGEAAGLIRPGNRSVRAYCLTGMVKELLYQIVLRKTDASHDELVDTMLDLTAYGLFTEAGARALRDA